MPKDPTNLSEAALTELSGISREDLRRIRREHLQEGVHFIAPKGAPLEYTQNGRWRILFIIASMAGQNGPKKEGGGAASASESPGNAETATGEKKEGGGDDGEGAGNAAVAIGKSIAEPPKPPDYITLKVDPEQLHNRNPRLVVCQLRTERGTELVKLRVKDNANFAPGMMVPLCIRASESLFDYRGKLPRKKGKL